MLLQEPILHEIFSVTKEDDYYIANCDITDVNNERYICDYVSREDDPFGLAPMIWKAVQKWIEEGNPVNES